MVDVGHGPARPGRGRLCCLPQDSTRGREWQGEVSGAVSCGQSQHCPESSREPLKMCQQERARALKNSLWLRAEDGWKGWPGQRNWGEMGAGGLVDQLQEEKQGQGRQS